MLAAAVLLAGMWRGTQAAVDVAERLLSPAERVQRMAELKEELAQDEPVEQRDEEYLELTGTIRTAEMVPFPRAHFTCGMFATTAAPVRTRSASGRTDGSRRRCSRGRRRCTSGRTVTLRRLEVVKPEPGKNFDPTNLAARSRELAIAIRRVAQERGVLYVDAAQVAHAGDDGHHLTLDSHARLAELFASTVFPAL